MIFSSHESVIQFQILPALQYLNILERDKKKEAEYKM